MLSTYVNGVGPSVKVANPVVKAELVALWRVNPLRTGAFSCQVSVTLPAIGVTKTPVPAKLVGAGGGARKGVTLLEEGDAAPVPLLL